MWHRLPLCVLLQLADFLGPSDLARLALVCSAWALAVSSVFNTGRHWRHLTICGHSPYRELEERIDTIQATGALWSVGRFIYTLNIGGVCADHILQACINLVTQHLRGGKGRLPLLKSVLICRQVPLANVVHRASVNSPAFKTYKALIAMMLQLRDMQHIRMLGISGVVGFSRDLVDSIAIHNHLSLRCLTLERCCVNLAGLCKFDNLVALRISHFMFGQDVLDIVAGSTIICLTLVQAEGEPYPWATVPSDQWIAARKRSPLLRIRIVKGPQLDRMLWPTKGAPVADVILYNAPAKSTRTFRKLSSSYHETLSIIIQLGLPVTPGYKWFSNRCDKELIKLVTCCHNLKYLALRELVSTFTVALIADRGKSLKHVSIRQKGVRIRRDWPIHLMPSTSQSHDTLNKQASSYLEVEKAMTSRVGYEWKLLTDRQYMRILEEEFTGI